MEQIYIKRIATLIILLGLIVLSYFVIKPFLLSALSGIFLALIFTPAYKKLKKYVKNKNVSATLICLLLAVIIIVPIWFLTPMLVKQSINIFIGSQQIDLITPLKNTFPSLFSYETFSNEIASTIQSFVTKITNSMMNILSNLILDFPKLFLHFLIVVFTFFFVLRDGDKLVSYIQSVLPFSKDVEIKLFKSSKDITFSVLYGQVVLGIVQGLIVGVAFFIFGVPNALLFTLLACLAGIFPIIGTTIVWLPVAIYMVISGGAIFQALGVVVFGVLSSILENVIKPIFISKRTRVHSAIILIGMVGGLFVFGILGVILGPLILSYLLIVLEIYRDKRLPGVFISKGEK